MSDTYHVVRMQQDHNGKLNVVSTLEVHNDLPTAIEVRDRLTNLSDQLMTIGVMFAVQYQIGIEQVRTLAGLTRKRLLTLDDHDSIRTQEEAFFGSTSDDLVASAVRELTGGAGE